MMQIAQMCLLACVFASGAQLARADARPGDPFAYNLRLALQPLAFQGGLTQRWFGSSARIEYGPVRWFDLLLDGRFSWFSANENINTLNYLARAGLAFHVSQTVREQALVGTVYPADVPAITTSVGSDQDMRGLPVGEKLASGSKGPRDRDVTLSAAMRSMHSLRVAVAHTRITERAHPDPDAWTRNRLWMLQLGYSYGTHWNLVTAVTGKREVGYRRFYADLFVTTSGLTKADPDRTPAGGRLNFVPVGGRVGMQGALEGLIEGAPSLGLAYDLELALTPGRGGWEGYLFLAMGLAFDVSAQ